MKALKGTWKVLANTLSGWSQHKAPRMGAALSYYTAFSIGPLVLIGISIAGMIYGKEAANNQIFDQLRGLMGQDAASVVQETVKGAAKPATSIIATIIGVVTLIFGAAGVFGELHDALNTIWGVKAKENQGVWGIIRERLFSFAMVASTGFLLIVSLLVTTVLAVMGKWLSTHLPGGEVLWQILNFVISLGIMSVLFALVLKLVPDVKMPWRTTFIGAAVTAALFTLGKFGLGLYIGKAGVASTYGAAGSMIVFLLWVFYSAQILYFGAELTRSLCEQWNIKVEPKRTAARVMSDEEIAHTPGAKTQHAH